MFAYDSLIDIRNLELFLFDGPETVEQVYERNDNFSSEHFRRRFHKDNGDVIIESIPEEKLWYSYQEDSNTGDMIYEIYD